MPKLKEGWRKFTISAGSEYNVTGITIQYMGIPFKKQIVQERNTRKKLAKLINKKNYGDEINLGNTLILNKIAYTTLNIKKPVTIYLR